MKKILVVMLAAVFAVATAGAHCGKCESDKKEEHKCTDACKDKCTKKDEKKDEKKK